MAQVMNDEQRGKALEEYNPKDHLIAVGKNKDGSKVLYYPAAWRLYELHLRYTNANFKSEIIYHDEAKGTVIVKAYLYLGTSYEASDKKAEAMKQGSIATLDKVETAAKARCARDFGIGTEYALDMTPDETDATHNAPTSVPQPQQPAQPAIPIATPRMPVVVPTLQSGNAQSKAVLDMIAKAKQRVEASQLLWDDIKRDALGSNVADSALTVQQVAKINGYMTDIARQAQSVAEWGPERIP